MFLMLGIIYATMGLISLPLISTPATKDEETSVRKTESLKPLEVLKMKWFYQVEDPLPPEFANSFLSLDMDWIFQYLRFNLNHRNIFQNIRIGVH